MPRRGRTNHQERERESEERRKNFFCCCVVQASLFCFSLETIKQFSVLRLCCPRAFFSVAHRKRGRGCKSSKNAALSSLRAFSFWMFTGAHVVMLPVPDDAICSMLCQRTLHRLPGLNSLMCTGLQLCSDAHLTVKQNVFFCI